MINKAEEAEIRRVFREEHNADMTQVLLGITGKLRILLKKATFNEDDMAMAESMLGFIVAHIPSELFPRRIDLIKELLWKAIDRGVESTIYDEDKGRYVNNFLWHKDY